MWIIALLILIFFEAVADIFSKEYSLNGKLLYWVLAITGYIIANVFWLYSIRNGSGLMRGAVLFSVGSALVAILIGSIEFHERLGTIQMVGIATGILAIILIFWPEITTILKS